MASRSSRASLILLCVAVCPKWASCQGPSWLGQVIIVNSRCPQMWLTSSLPSRIVARPHVAILVTLDEIDYTVEKENGDWVLVRQRGLAGWSANATWSC